MKTQKHGIILGIIVTVMSLTGCGLISGRASADKPDNRESDNANNDFVVTGPESYDSADTAVLVSQNKDDNTVTFLNLILGKRYTLTVDGTTGLYDKYGGALSLDQIKAGDIVDITFLKSKKRLNTMQLSGEAWSYDAVERFEIDSDRMEMFIGQEVYKLSRETLFYSGSRPIEMMDLNPADILTVKGLGNNVLSVRVEKGHGYLRLTNDEQFIGGWIEVGSKTITRIAEDMLLTVPEGSYQVLISHNGGGGTKEVLINRNEEITLDIGDLEVAEVKSGNILFSLSPAKTTIYIDGSQVDTSAPVSLEYGIHQIIARADGYKTVTSYLKVGQESAGIDIVLEALGAGEEDKPKDSGSVSDSDSDTTTGYYKVNVDAPAGAEVYLDGSYVGISPCSFRKTAGAHIITLRRDGYTTRSYTVQIDSEKKDVSFSFADLIQAAP